MEKIIAYVDDAGYAQQHLLPLIGGGPVPTHWVLVACAPRVTRRVSKWVSNSARQSWRQRWSDKLFEQLVPALRTAGGEITTVVAKGPLTELTRSLIAEHGVARVLDARRPKFGEAMQPVVAGQPDQAADRWSVPGAVAGLGAVLVLAAE